MNKKVLKLAIPNIITNITVPLLGMVDIAIVGHIGNATYIGGVALGAMIFNLIYWNFGFLRMGTTGFAAQAYGARNLPQAVNVLVRSLSVAFVIAILLIVLQTPIIYLILYFLEGSPQVEQLAHTYFSILIWAAPATLGLYAIKGWFIGMQNAKIPMFIALLINILNIGFSFLFVFGFHMNIAGVALATLIAQYGGLILSLILCYYYYGRLKKYIDFLQSLKWKEMIRFFKINSDIFLRTLCLIIVFTFIPSVSAKMGDEILAINTLLMQLFTLFSYIMDGFAYAGESLTGKYIGARNRLLLRKSIRVLFGWGFLFTISFTILYALGGKNILALLTNNKQLIEQSGQYLFWVLLVPVAGFSAFLWDGIYVGATASQYMRNAMFISTVLFFIVYYSLHKIFENNALWLAFIIYLLFRGLIQWKFSKKAIFKPIENFDNPVV